MKTFFIIVIIAVLGYFGWQQMQTQPDPATPTATVTDEVSTTTDTSTSTTASGKQVDNSKVTVAFTGFGPGKKHVGSFSDVRSDLKLDAKGDIAGSITVGVSSLSTDTEKVTEHLKTDDFFDTAKYPTATFTITNDLTASTCGGANVRCAAPYLYGNFTIHGVTKGVSFPVVRSADKYTATFTIDMKEFGIDQTFANETVELQVVVPIK